MRFNLKNKNVLITGGLGFIGSNLAIALVESGANVSLLDNLTPNQGGNLFNVYPIKNKIKINYCDIRDSLAVNQIVKDKDFIFHLARQTDHILSLKNPYVDIDVNIKGTTVLLEASRINNPGVKLIYIGTRGQYGKAVKLPVSESAATNPKGIYEVTNLAAEKIVKIYNDIHKIKSVMLRLTNVYGPRSQMKHDRYGVVNWFVRLAMDGEEIPVFGKGKLRRDFLYVDDAISAIIKCAIKEVCYGEIINVGKDHGETFLGLVKEIIRASGSGSYKFAPFTPERAGQEPGDFISDISKIRKLTGWIPKTKINEGLRKTVAFYKKNRKNYW